MSNPNTIFVVGNDQGIRQYLSTIE